MPRKPLLRTGSFPYHVGARANNKDWFYIPVNEVWDLFSELFVRISDVYPVQIHAFVLMSNHFHALMTFLDGNIDKVMQYLLRECSKEINRLSGRINHVFGGPYHWSVVDNSYHYGIVYKYVYRNPVEAGICERVEDYPFSTLRSTLFGEASQFPIQSSRFCMQLPFGTNYEEHLRWLNQAYSKDQADMVRRALKKRRFEFKPNRAVKRNPYRLFDSARTAKVCHTNFIP